MKKKICLIVASFLLITIAPFTNVKSEAIEVSGSASVDVMSNYVWRGLKLTDGYAVQPSVGITHGGFGVNIWANWDSDVGDTAAAFGTPGVKSAGEHTETDLTLNYTFSIDKLSIDLGYIYYALDSIADTQEIYVSAAYDVILSPSVTVYYDFEEGTGAYIEAAVGHSVEIQEGITLDLGASASYVIDNNIVAIDKNGKEFSDFHNGQITASLTIPITKNISIAPMIAYTTSLSDDAEDAMDFNNYSADKDDSFVYGGINATISF